ncbi:MAG TPA: hypothetical protein VLA97_03205 [Nocardioidaceae bacterium]|jgi:hypothetical protein|nr:hypothetical protein [Nocardioidaceae bacterium]
MPMPPPKPTTESRRDRQVFHEMGQIVRALESEGPQTPDRLALILGARFWEADRFDRALALAVSDGLVVRGADGTLAAS